MYKRRAVAHAKLGQYAAALEDLKTAFNLNPADLSILFWLGSDLATAPEDFHQGLLALAEDAIKRSPDPGSAHFARARLYYELALARLAAGDHEAYRAACQRMIQALRETGDPQEAQFIAWTCALAAGALDDYEPAIAFARRAADSDPKSTQFLTTLGAILYRAGQTQEAIACLTESDRSAAELSEKANASPAYAWYFLAMAQHQAGHRDEARSNLEKANVRTTRALDDQENPLPWNRRLTLELLRHEAEELLGDASDGHGVPECEALPEGESPKLSPTDSPKDATEG
jgi:tetratricopeptide (TPR) repeat protein